MFHPIIQDWFHSRFEAPTEPQARGWPHIAAGEPTLIAAPTGSGKTLTAFLAVIDRLFREAVEGKLRGGVRVVYVSPLRALSNDMHRNLETPLQEILETARAAGLEVPPIRVGLRTGDTPAHRRAAMLKKPPHILVTTPESLFLMLTSEKSRAILEPVETVIVDEIHALVRDKRGSHLALSLERLEALVQRRIQRIGLSATQKPIERMGEFLAGAEARTPGAGAGTSGPDPSVSGTSSVLPSFPSPSRTCTIVDVGHARDLDLGVEIPPSDVQAVCSHEQWAEVHNRIVELIKTHRSTLIFVNTRRLAERVTHQLTQLLGEEAVGSHHGSLSKELRLSTEQKLKNGELKGVVATSSLELGIDVGFIDLVVQIGSPRGIAAFLQRIGRSGHALGLTPKGRLFALTRDELVECLALIRAVRQGRLDVTPVPEAPLDILAQQIVAELACREWNADDLFHCFTRAWPYRLLNREQFDRVLEILSSGLTVVRDGEAPGARGEEGREENGPSLRTGSLLRSDESGETSPPATAPSPGSPPPAMRGSGRRLIYHDRINNRLKGRRGARLAALNNGGAIAEIDSVRVVLEDENTVVGSVDEDFAVESTAGDIFLLGNSSWRIRRLRGNDLVVSDAQGAPPTIPFWRGEAPGRTIELSEEISRLREEIERRLIALERGQESGAEGTAGAFSLTPPPLALSAPPLPAPLPADEKRTPVVEWLRDETLCSPEAAAQVVDYIAAQRAAIGVVPTQKRIVFERFFDESGGMQLVVHAPFGGRINRAWGLAFRKRFCRSFDFELQASADDDGFILSLGPQHSFPIESLFPMMRTDNARNLLEQALLAVPMFHLRWRWNLTRALFLDRMRNGKKVPPALQRFRAEDLLTAVFPNLTGCQENITGDHEIPDHPLVQQTVADCLSEAMDLPGLLEVLGRIEAGELTLIGRDTREPSPFAYELLNANPYAFLDGGEIQERRARAVSTRRSVTVESIRDLGRLDPRAIEAVVAEAQPEMRDADELHDLLLGRLLVPVAESGQANRGGENASSRDVAARLTLRECDFADFLETLGNDGRALRVTYGESRSGWVASERWPSMQAIYPEARSTGGASGSEPSASTSAPPHPSPPSRSEALTLLLRGWVETCGPVTAEELAGLLDLPVHQVFASLEALEGEGLILRGRFRENDPSGPAEPVRNGTPTPAPSPGTPPTEWCHRRLLARIHRRTISGLRREIEAVDVATYAHFLARHQGAVAGRRRQGIDGVHAAISQLQGLDLAAAAWEESILPSRVDGYQPAWLDELCLTGEVGWGRLEPKPRSRSTGRPMASMTRAIPVSLYLREDLPWLTARAGASDAEQLSSTGRQISDLLHGEGALFAADLLQRTQMLPTQLDDVLGELVSAGFITSDLFAGLRGLIRSTSEEKSPRVRSRQTRVRRPPQGVGRWTLWRTGEDSPPRPGEPRHDESIEEWAWQLIRRWGVVFRDLVLREPLAPQWWELLKVYRQLEARGELRGGRFVRGVSGEQFATSEAIRELRDLKKGEAAGDFVVASAADPLNLTGVIGGGKRIPALAGNRVAYLDGELVGWKKGDAVRGEPGDEDAPSENVWIAAGLSEALTERLASAWGVSGRSRESVPSTGNDPAGERQKKRKPRSSRSGIPRPFPF